MTTPENQQTTQQWVHDDTALATALGAKLSTVRTWRKKGLIPFIKTGHRSISYCVPKVLAALEALETPAKPNE